MKLPIFASILRFSEATLGCCNELGVLLTPEDDKNSHLDIDTTFELSEDQINGKAAYNGPIIRETFYAMAFHDEQWIMRIKLPWQSVFNTEPLLRTGDDGYCFPLGTFEGEFSGEAFNATTVCNDEVLPLNCYDKKNGGCSHICNHKMQRCECPTCMQLTDDGMNCGPEPDKVNITCSSDGMEISIDQCVFGKNVVQVGFDSEDENCQSENVEDSGSDSAYLVRSELDKCGMVMAPGNGTVDFSNTLSVLSRHSSNNIQIRSGAGVEFQCKLDTSAQITVSAEIQKADDGSQATSGSGDFQFHAGYYTDDTFGDKVAANSTEHGFLGERLFLGIYPEKVLSGVSFSVHSCVVSDSENSFPIIAEGCPSIAVKGEIHSEYFTDDFWKFSYEAFKFTENAAMEETDMTVTCTVEVCTNGCDEPTC